MPLSYLILTITFPDFNKVLFFTYLFILGETHFAGTWLFFMHPKNRIWVSNEKYFEFIYIPLLSIPAIIFIILKSIPIALFLILLFNFWHVTRQSIGIIKLYSTIKNINNELIIIYLINLACIIVGISRFVIQLNIIDQNLNLFYLTTIIPMILFLGYRLYCLKKKVNIYFIASVLTSIFIYIPLLFSKSIQDAFILGVGMHYSQYLALVLPINIRKFNSINNSKNNNLPKVVKGIFIYLFIYSLIMVSLTLSKTYINFLYLVPVFFQLIHFYIDGIIWKFSSPYLRENIGKYIFKSI